MEYPAKHTAVAVTMIAALTLALGSAAFAAPGRHNKTEMTRAGIT